MPEQVPASLRTALADLLQWLDGAGVPSMLIGGVAASVLGQPRLTQDIDVMAVAPESAWVGLVEAGARHGIAPRITGAVEFAVRSRVLLMRHEASGIDTAYRFTTPEQLVADSLADVGRARGQRR
ncbi:MAG: hypothetical protein HRU81_03335 [Gammaproteobacteria bacterium]|nr:MAG: hypothetical protein HRU81_03335 [Gammaproteobacteria bacterium]